MVMKRRIRTRSLSPILISLSLQAPPAEHEPSATSIRRNATDEINCNQTAGMPLTFRPLHYQFITKRSEAITGVLQLPLGQSFPDEKEGRMRKLLIDRSLSSATRKFKFVITRYSRAEGKQERAFPEDRG